MLVKRALGLGDLRRREEEDLGLDVLGLDLAARHFRRGVPEGGGLVQPVVLHHQPLELAHRRALQLGVERRRRVLADAEHALDLAVVHRDEHRHVRVVAEILGCQS